MLVCDLTCTQPLREETLMKTCWLVVLCTVVLVTTSRTRKI